MIFFVIRYLHFVDDRDGKATYFAEMTNTEFNEWLKAMRVSGAEAARLLGVNVNTVSRYKRNGAPKSVGLACAALFHRLGEWK
jgi:DNA-binding transcriptional regulator YiaG